MRAEMRAEMRERARLMLQTARVSREASLIIEKAPLISAERDPLPSMPDSMGAMLFSHGGDRAYIFYAEKEPILICLGGVIDEGIEDMEARSLCFMPRSISSLMDEKAEEIAREERSMGEVSVAAVHMESIPKMSISSMAAEGKRLIALASHWKRAKIEDECSIAMRPMTMGEVLSRGDMELPLWRDFMLAEACSRMREHMISPCHPLVGGHSLIPMGKGTGGSVLYQTPHVLDRWRLSSAYGEIEEALHTVMEQGENTKEGAKKRDRAIQRSMDAIISYHLLSPFSFMYVRSSSLLMPRDVLSSSASIFMVMYSLRAMFERMGLIYTRARDGLIRMEPWVGSSQKGSILFACEEASYFLLGVEHIPIMQGMELSIIGETFARREGGMGSDTDKEYINDVLFEVLHERLPLDLLISRDIIPWLAPLDPLIFLSSVGRAKEAARVEASLRESLALYREGKEPDGEFYPELFLSMFEGLRESRDDVLDVYCLSVMPR